MKIKIRKDCFLLCLSMYLLAWQPAEIKSETQHNTSYYPAPYGGYDRLVTKGDTYLARNSSSVYWGYSGQNQLNSDFGGSIKLTGPNVFAMPGIVFSNAAHTSRITHMSYYNLPVISVSSDFSVGRSSDKSRKLVAVCNLMGYQKGAVTYCGGNVSQSKSYMILPASVSNRSQSVFYNFAPFGITIPMPNVKGIALPQSGEMVCCRFEVR